MILAVDAGNTRVKVSVVDAGSVTALFDMPTSRLAADVHIFSEVLGACSELPRRLDGAAVCSVVPGTNRAIEAALRRVVGAPPVVVGHASILPFRLKVANPANVGSDRLAAAAGALGRRRTHAIVVDAGTAITVDLVVRREFRGGLIMAGPELALDALGTYARRLPRIGKDALLARPTGRFDDTEPAMLLGARAAAAGAVIEGVRILRLNAGFSPGVVVTGGGLGVIGDRLPRGWRREPDLVARGLFRLWVLNGSRGKKKP
jgi:type III pantothenate kinase